MKKNKIFIGAISLLLISPITSYALTKTETVHVNIDYTGTVKKTTVNTKLTQLDSGDITDYTYLTDIKNLDGEEKLALENNKLTFKSTGKDLVYQGKINSELPVTISSKYYLDGQEVNPKDIIGKKGKVKIEYDLSNNSYDYNSHMHTPFVVSYVSLLNNKHNSNINVNTGKIVTAGNKNIVIGIAAPGLYDDLNLSELSDMDSIVITYDTTKFEMNDSYFAMTPKLLEDIDISNLNKVDGLNSSLNTLQDGMNKLENGSKELVAGSNGIDTGMESLTEGINKALEGSKSITNGLSQVEVGSTKLESLNTLVDTLYSSYNENKQLLDMISKGDAENQYKQAINEATMAKTDLENKLSSVNAGISGLEQGGALGVLTEEQIAQLDNLRKQKIQLEAGIKQYAEGIAKAESDMASLPLKAAALEGANQAIEQVLKGVIGNEITTDNINTFKEQINALVGGITELTNGSNELTNGLNELQTGSKKLKNGTNSLTNGSKELSNGIIKINNEGIKKLSSYGSKITNYSNRAKALVRLSKNYNGFASDNSDNTIFIYKVTK